MLMVEPAWQVHPSRRSRQLASPFGTAGTRTRFRQKQSLTHVLKRFTRRRNSAGPRPAAASFAEPSPAGSGEIKLPLAASSRSTFGEIVRRRRSALDFRAECTRCHWRNFRQSSPGRSPAILFRFRRCTFYPALCIRPSYRWAATRCIPAAGLIC